jgi:hypothetical protein
MKKNGFATSSRYGKELFICTIEEQGGQDDILLVQRYRILWRINAVAR